MRRLYRGRHLLDSSKSMTLCSDDSLSGAEFVWWDSRVGVSAADLERVARPSTGWPAWVVDAPYVASAYPRLGQHPDPTVGANCQTYAYAVLSLFGQKVPPHRSSDLWEDLDLPHVDRGDERDLDLVLFNEEDVAWGAHVAMVFGDRLLHLCAEIGHPDLWDWNDFTCRERYSTVVGIVRVPPNAEGRNRGR
jgi:hypothetical protein